MAEQLQNKAVQTTGHAWDGDLQEFNNPLPSWWLWAFYASVLFALVYWVLFPAWPIGSDYTKGLATATFKNDQGEEVTMGWNSRAAFIQEMQEGGDALKQKAYLQKVSAVSYDEISRDPEMTAFAESLAKVVFADNCAACHGIGGTPPIVGLYPNLRDDDWLWGGTFEQIEHTISQGRIGFMPAFGKVLDKGQVDQLAHYVLGLSGHEADPAKAKLGEAIFQGEEGGCHYCHTQSGKGLYSQGAANLTDAIWTVADVTGQTDLKDKVKLVSQVIDKGIEREMPGWSKRLSEIEIKLLTVYVHSLSGGE
jgi:cytochrome c oxidase cbb3-type subunit 3